MPFYAIDNLDNTRVHIDDWLLNIFNRGVPICSRRAVPPTPAPYLN